jgi:cystathionine gamma-synthase
VEGQFRGMVLVKNGVLISISLFHSRYSLVLSPISKHYQDLKATLESIYEDSYFPEDAIYMERNSRDFRHRIATINDNAYDLTEMLVGRSLMNPSGEKNTVLKHVYYPRYMSPENYSVAQRLPTTGKGGFGGLFSLTFTTLEASRTFFDALECDKGPSLGTNFTLACPYTLLAHYLELDWASEFGVEAGLVRVSVGLEEIEGLKAAFNRALDAAQRTAEGQSSEA